MTKQYDVVIIGAGPAGSIAALLLRQQGFSVCVIEKQHFPRYVVGESLLPLGMDVLEEAGVLHIIENEPFHLKNGIAFTYQNHYTAFDFRYKHGKGKNFALQVDRARFDQILIHQAQKRGADVHFGEAVINMDNSNTPMQLLIQQNSGIQYPLSAQFVLDASGYFRAVPRLLGWEITQGITQHNVYHTQINDCITHPKFDRNKNLIAVHPEYRDIWMWLIPLDNQRSSVGLVGQAKYFKRAEEKAGRLLGASELLKQYFGEVPMFQKIMPQANWDNGFPFYYIPSYSAGVQAIHGYGFAILGNAAGFLDPVFSSGISSAMYFPPSSRRMCSRASSMAKALIGKANTPAAKPMARKYSKPASTTGTTARCKIGCSTPRTAPNRAKCFAPCWQATRGTAAILTCATRKSLSPTQAKGSLKTKNGFQAAFYCAPINAPDAKCCNLIRPRHCDCQEQKRQMQQQLPHHLVFRQPPRVDKRLQQMNRRNADNRHRQLHFQHRRIHMVEPFGLVGVVVHIQARHKSLVAANQHHHQQIGNHHHINQIQHRQHHGGFVHGV